MIYLDSSALLKRYLDESDSERFVKLMSADMAWITVRITWVEVRRNLARQLQDRQLSEARSHFRGDWASCRVVEVDETTCDLAAELAELTGVRTLDALHLAAIQRVGAGGLPLLTADVRQAQAARSLGWTVLSA